MSHSSGELHKTLRLIFIWPLFLLRATMRPVYLSHLWSDSSAGAVRRVRVWWRGGKSLTLSWSHIHLSAYATQSTSRTETPHPLHHPDLVNNLVTHRQQKLTRGDHNIVCYSYWSLRKQNHHNNILKNYFCIFFERQMHQDWDILEVSQHHRLTEPINVVKNHFR